MKTGNGSGAMEGVHALLPGGAAMCERQGQSPTFRTSFPFPP